MGAGIVFLLAVSPHSVLVTVPRFPTYFAGVVRGFRRPQSPSTHSPFESWPGREITAAMESKGSEDGGMTSNRNKAIVPALSKYLFLDPVSS